MLLVGIRKLEVLELKDEEGRVRVFKVGDLVEIKSSNYSRIDNIAIYTGVIKSISDFTIELDNSERFRSSSVIVSYDSILSVEKIQLEGTSSTKGITMIEGDFIDLVTEMSHEGVCITRKKLNCNESSDCSNCLSKKLGEFINF